MTVKYIVGDVRDVLKTLPEEKFNTVVTSPPYWGLRDYGIEPVVWGEEESCEHEWGEELPPVSQSNWDTIEWNDGRPKGASAGWKKEVSGTKAQTAGSYCSRCGAWRGSLGLEPTPELYVRHLIEIFQGVRRVLRKDGTLWLNLGDSYNAMQGKQNMDVLGRQYKGGGHKTSSRHYSLKKPTPPGLKPKDLVGIPWSVAFALRADGWWLRSDIIWHKPNPMPESVQDRPTKAHEYLFLLSKSGKYYYDADVIREPIKEASIERYKYSLKGSYTPGSVYPNEKREHPHNWVQNPEKGRNRRTVWTIPTKPYSDAHFAVFPEELIKPCILAGAPLDGWVLDPFAGSGTTLAVSRRLRRNAIGIDINGEYKKLARKRAHLNVKVQDLMQYVR